MTPRIFLFALLMLLPVCGCATSDSKQDRGQAGAQTAGDSRFIVVPVFILSAPKDGLPGSGGDVLPVPDSPDRTSRRGGSAPVEM
jgi:hypothetical protein